VPPGFFPSLPWLRSRAKRLRQTARDASAA
jgi:hypothetical protein